MRCTKILRICLFPLVILSVISCTHNADISGFPDICFTSEILPVFQNSCAMTGCHDGNGESRLVLTTYPGIMEGITPGNPSASRFYQSMISKWGGNRMPPDQPVSIENREKIRIWIEQGAVETTCSQGNTGNQGDTYVARACFSRDILPVIVSYCASAGCHDVASHAEGYNLSTYTGIRSTVVPGNKTNSRLYRVITTAGGENKMPPSGSPQLTVAQIDSIGKWITYGALNENCGEVCDTVSAVTFSGVINPVIQLTCTGCHSGTNLSGNVNLGNYSGVATAAANGSLLKSLTGSGVTKMPPSGSLSTCRIRQFTIWVNNGYKNN